VQVAGLSEVREGVVTCAGGTCGRCGRLVDEADVEAREIAGEPFCGLCVEILLAWDDAPAIATGEDARPARAAGPTRGTWRGSSSERGRARACGRLAFAALLGHGDVPLAPFAASALVGFQVAHPVADDALVVVAPGHGGCCTRTRAVRGG
jgi:hypothetical protein